MFYPGTWCPQAILSAGQSSLGAQSKMGASHIGSRVPREPRSQTSPAALCIDSWEAADGSARLRPLRPQTPGLHGSCRQRQVPTPEPAQSGAGPKRVTRQHPPMVLFHTRVLAFVFVMLELKPRASCALGRCSATKRQSQVPKFLCLFFCNENDDSN